MPIFLGDFLKVNDVAVLQKITYLLRILKLGLKVRESHAQF